MSDNVDVSGELNIGYTSYWNPEKHGHMSKTIGGTTEDDKHSEEIVTLPKEVDVHKLTEKQERVIREAAKNPKLTAMQVEDNADVSDGYASKVLRDKCPNWYENVFQQYSDGRGRKPKSTRNTNTQETDTEGKESDTTSKRNEEIETACEVIQATSENPELVAFASWVGEKL